MESYIDIYHHCVQSLSHAFYFHASMICYDMAFTKNKIQASIDHNINLIT